MESLVVLDIAATDIDFRISILEFFKNVPGALAHDIGQHIETSTVSHADNDMAYPLANRLVNGLIEERDEGFRTLQRKRFGSDKFLLDEMLKDHCIRESLQNSDLLFFWKD